MPPSDAGFSVLEVLVVTALLAVLTLVVALHAPSADAPAKAEAAAHEIADALRFARSESLRTGRPHGVRLDVDTERVRVYWLNTSGASPVEVFNVFHPAERTLFDRRFDDRTYTAGADLARVDFRFTTDATSRPSVAFSRDGSPISAADLALLEVGVVQVKHGLAEVKLGLEPHTGRVDLP